MDTGILHSLIFLGDFKAVLGLDDREQIYSSRRPWRHSAL
jgi:hypothetical protein